MQSIHSALQGLGLGKNDVKVYLALLKSGRLTVVDMATKSGVHRVNVYDSLRQLQALGLVAYSVVGKKTYYVASDPDQLLSILKKKEDEVSTIIPQLKQFYEQTENQAQIFEGLDGIKLILNDMLGEKKSISAFGIPKKMPELLSNFLKTFHARRIQNKMKINHIYNENAKERIAYLNSLDGSLAKYLPPEYSVPATTIIYGNKVAFWIWSDTPFCVLISSEKMATAYEKYFTLLWSLAK